MEEADLHAEFHDDQRIDLEDVVAALRRRLDPTTNPHALRKALAEVEEDFAPIHESEPFPLAANGLQLLQVVIDYLPVAVSIFDGHLHMVACNAMYKTLLDFPESMFANGLPHFEAFLRYNAERGEYGNGDPEEIIRSVMERALHAQAHKFQRTRPNGTVLEICGTPLPGGGFATIYTDVSARRQAEPEARPNAGGAPALLPSPEVRVHGPDLTGPEIHNPVAAITASDAIDQDAQAAPEPGSSLVTAGVAASVPLASAAMPVPVPDPSQSPLPGGQTGAASAADGSPLESAEVEEDDFKVRLREVFRAGIPARMGELNAALAAKDSETSSRLLHGLKGSAGYLEAQTLYELCCVLEKDAEKGNWNRINEAMPRLLQILDAC